MPGLEGYDCEGELTIDGISMNTPAWAIVGDENGVGGLWGLKTRLETRGEDRLVPGAAAGVIPYPRRRAPLRYDLRFLMTGDVDDIGDPKPDARVGLEENLALFNNDILAPITSGDGTRELVLSMFSGGTLTFDAHIIGFMEERVLVDGARHSILEGRLQISVPAGVTT